MRLESTCIIKVVSIGCLFMLCFWFGGSAAVAAEDCNLYGCSDDCLFTADFRLDNCRFKSKGINPWFILLPGYSLVLETPLEAEERERSVETVLHDTKWIHLDGRWIKTRVLEERAFEWDDGDWVNIEISRNYFAICERTNAVYYFGEWSRDCEEGFDENDVCPVEESHAGSWEAGVNGARPGLIMPGTPLQGARYYQEVAPPDAVDRGEVAATGLDISLSSGQWSECIQIIDTNPAEQVCGDGDEKTYCPRVGLVEDQDLELIWYGFVGRGGHHGKKGDHRRHEKRLGNWH